MLWCTMLWWVYDVKGLINSQNGSIIKGDIYVHEKLVELTYITQSLNLTTSLTVLSTHMRRMKS